MKVNQQTADVNFSVTQTVYHFHCGCTRKIRIQRWPAGDYRGALVLERHFRRFGGCMHADSLHKKGSLP